MHGDCPCVKPDQPGTTQLKNTTYKLQYHTIFYYNKLTAFKPFILAHMILFFYFLFLNQVYHWWILRVDGLRNLTICSIIGPSSSSSVTKWLVAPISFTPASYACNFQIGLNPPINFLVIKCNLIGLEFTNHTFKIMPLQANTSDSGEETGIELTNF